MKNSKNFWLIISLANLLIVASLGVLLRSKILFPIPFLDYSSILHAHSHFAFGGWVTLALLSLITYEILPEKFNRNKKYNYSDQLHFLGCFLPGPVSYNSPANFENIGRLRTCFPCFVFGWPFYISIYTIPQNT